ncbi:MAG: putative DNA binding domain-containing protein [Bacteroidetes bacterium]|nr:putative DNA binding domain-containing protein [Bacteroidota bacterium]
MITSDDIKLLIASGEGYNAEFKVSVPAKVRELSEEICAFANAAGGVLLLGVNDSNQIVGVSIDNAKRSAIQNSLGEITPHLPCSLSLLEVDGFTVGVIEVPSGQQKPYVLSGAIFVRIGPNTQKLTTAEQMRDFFQQSDRIYFDEAPCEGFSWVTMVDQDFLPIFNSEAHISSGVPREQLFDNLKLFGSRRTFKNGAVLFFGKNPEQVFDKAIVRCLAFQGTDKRYISDDKSFGGNLYHQYQQAMQWLKGKLNIRYDIEGQGSGPRKEIWEIPETIFKETIINSLSHRDYYDKGGVIHIEVFDDRVEISNPGGLVSAIPEAEFGKRSHSRNPLVFGLFARMHLVEQVGSGIGRIKDLMKEAGLPDPEFRKEGIFAVILNRPSKSAEKGKEKSVEKGKEKSAEKILEMIKSNKNITTKELAEKIGLSPSAIEKQIKKLKESDLIERVGADKGGYWKILKKET